MQAAQLCSSRVSAHPVNEVTSQQVWSPASPKDPLLHCCMRAAEGFVLKAVKLFEDILLYSALRRGQGILGSMFGDLFSLSLPLKACRALY